MKINLVTLCSGIEAQGQAMRRLCRDYPEYEWDLLAWSEIDKDAILAHNAIFPEYADRNIGDMTLADYSKITEPVDVLFYSTPCQSVSVAGQNKGMEEGTDAASALIWHTRRAIETLKPKVCILENVKGMIMGKNLKEFHKWCEVMESYGYTNFAKVLNSKDYGVPQNRERIFMISILDCPQSYHFPEPFKLEKRIKDILEPYGTVDESFYFSPEQLLRTIAHCDKTRDSDIQVFGKVNNSQDGIIVTEDSVSPCHCVGPGNMPKVAEQIKEGISIHPLNRKTEFQGFKSIKSDTEPCLTSHDGRGGEPVLWQRLSIYDNNAQAGRVYDVEGIAPCLDTCNGGNRMPKILTPVRTEEAKELRRKGIEVFKHRELVPREDGVSNTITTVSHDNCLIEPAIIQRPHGFNNGGLFSEVSPTITTSSWEANNLLQEPVAVAMRGRNPDNPSDRSKGAPTEQRLEFGDNIANCITTVQKDSMVAEPMIGNDPRRIFGKDDFQSDVCPALMAVDYKAPKLVKEPIELSFANLPDKTVLKDDDGRGYLWQDNALWRVRRLVPIEVGRLMDCSDEDIHKMIDAGISKSALYGLFGNSIVISVLYHIFFKLFIDTSNESPQKSLFDF